MDVKVDDTKLRSQLTRAKSAVTKTVDKIKHAFSKMAAAFKTAFTKIVRVAKWGAVAIAGAIAASVKAFATFKTAMAEVATMLTEQYMYLLPKYSREIKRLAVDFGESSTVLARALYSILSASIAPTKALEVLAIAAEAAKAGITETSVAAYAMTGIMNAYGFAAEDAGKVSDILFAIVKKGQTTFGELAPAIGRVTAIAASAGITFEQVGAALATITRGGIGTNEAVTGLRAALIALMGKEKGAVELAKEHEVELSIQTLKTEQLTGMVQKLSKLSPEVLKNIFKETEARTALNILIKDQTGLLGDYESTLKSAGATQEAFEKMTDTLNFSFGRLWQSIKITSIEIGETLGPAVKDASDAMREWIATHRPEVIRKFIDAIETIIKSVAKLSEKIAMGTVHLTRYQIAWYRAGLAVYKASDVMTLGLAGYSYEVDYLTKEIDRLIIKAAEAYIAAETNIPKITDFFEKLRAKIKSPEVPAALKVIKETTVDLELAFKKFWEAAKDTSAELRFAFLPSIKEVNDKMREWVSTAGQATKMFDKITSRLSSLKQEIDETTKALTEGAEKHREELAKIDKETVSHLSNVIKMMEAMGLKGEQHHELKLKQMRYEAKAYSEMIGGKISAEEIFQLMLAKQQQEAEARSQAYIDKVVKDQQDLARARVEALASMYSEMKYYSEDYAKLQKALIEYRIADFKKLGIEEVDIMRWRNEQLKNLDMEMSMTAQVMRDTFRDVFFDAMRGELKSFGDYFVSMTERIQSRFADMLSDMVIDWIMKKQIMQMAGGVAGGVMGMAGSVMAGLFHKGGIVGQPVPVRAISTDVFAKAPRLHQGLGSQEFPAILERGERVIPKDQAPAPIIFNINTIDAQSFDSYLAARGGTIANIVQRATRDNHPFRRS